MSTDTPVTQAKTSSQSKSIRKRWLNEQTAVAFLFILPSMIGFIIFYVVPAVRAVTISFTDWDLLTTPTNIGLENYQKLLQDPNFWNSLKVTIYYVLLNIPIQTALAIVIAVIMDRATKNIVVRAIIILPWLFPNVVVGLLWLWMLDPTIGIVNEFLRAIGLNAQPFLTSVELAMPSIAGINVWRHVGYTALLVFAGLQAIPKSVYEAASIDGSSELRTFFQITVPLLRPVLVFVIVTSVIGSFQLFDTVAVTTTGGPVNATEVLNWFIYENAFERFNMGYATAIAVVLFFILILVSLVQMRILRADESDLA